jgi:hypothetical protein
MMRVKNTETTFKRTTPVKQLNLKLEHACEKRQKPLSIAPPLPNGSA